LISYPAVLRAQQQEGGYEFVFLESLFLHFLAVSPPRRPPFFLLLSGNSRIVFAGGGLEISRQVNREEWLPEEEEEMITRAKLVEQLREHQIRSAQSYSAALSVFSPNPHISSRSGSHRPAAI